MCFSEPVWNGHSRVRAILNKYLKTSAKAGAPHLPLSLSGLLWMRGKGESILKSQRNDCMSAFQGRIIPSLHTWSEACLQKTTERNNFWALQKGSKQTQMLEMAVHHKDIMSHLSHNQMAWGNSEGTARHNQSWPQLCRHVEWRAHTRSHHKAWMQELCAQKGKWLTSCNHSKRTV